MTLTNMVTRCTVIGIMTVLIKCISVKHIFSVDNLGKAWAIVGMGSDDIAITRVCIYCIYEFIFAFNIEGIICTT